MSVFKESSRGLKFTLERQDGQFLQFLDLRMQFTGEHVCWGYKPRTQKGILPYDSAHSKLVKRSIASSCLETAIGKSCHHAMHDSLCSQVKRLGTAGYPTSLMLAVAEKLLKKFRGKSQKDKQKKRARPHVMPYLHRVSHNIKKWRKGSRYLWYSQHHVNWLNYVRG